MNKVRYKIDELSFELFWRKCTLDERIALTMLNKRHKYVAYRTKWSPTKSSNIRNKVLAKLEHMFLILYNDDKKMGKNG